MKTPISLVAAALSIACLAPGAFAQPLQERVNKGRQPQPAKAAAPSAAEKPERPRKPAGLDLRDIPAKQAVEYIANASGVQIVVNWDNLQGAGIDPEHPVQLVGRGISAAKLLDMVCKQLSPDDALIWEVSGEIVEIITKEQANQRSVVMLYPIADLLHEVPNFSNAPTFDLQQITQQGSQGGSGAVGGSGGGGGGRSGGSGSLFSGSGSRDSEKEKQKSAEEKAEQIADLIRQSIEPDIWRENGGTYGSIKFHNGNLIIRAPMYVHRQIGGGISTEDRPAARASAPSATAGAVGGGASAAPGASGSSGVSGPSGGGGGGVGGGADINAPFPYPKGHRVAGVR